MRKKIVSGSRPTGNMHLGHYFGILKNWVSLSEEYDCYYFIADWHALTTNYDSPENISAMGENMVLDMLAAGISLDKAEIFYQSKNRFHAELYLILSMITPVSWLERNPSYKDLVSENVGKKDLAMHGFLGYPVLMAADILLYNADYVPVGKDQQAHVELTREIARRFNNLYGEGLMSEPESLLTEAAIVPGTDGRKMSKSYDNAITLSEDIAITTKKVMGMMTDTKRQRRSDPGEPDDCPVYYFHKLMSPSSDIEECAIGCRSASIGCVDCKKILLGNMTPFLEQFQDRRKAFTADIDEVKAAIEASTKKSEQQAGELVEKVKTAMKI